MIKKQCSKCKQIKPITEFAPRCDRACGLQSHCRQCQETYRQTHHQDYRKYQNAYCKTEKFKIKRRKYQKSKHYKQWLKNYRQGEIFKLYTKKYRQSKKGKLSLLQTRKKYAVNHPERERAHDAVKYTVKTGKLPRPDTFQCTYCPKQAKQYHHPDYSKPLFVFPTCRICHRIIHN